MIVDADCHLSSCAFDSMAVLADGLIATMDRAGVDQALVWLRPPYNRDIGPENRAVYDASRRYPERILAMGWANPRLGPEATRDTIKQCYEEYGFLGLKFNGAQDDYVIDDEQLAMPFVEQAARYGKPIAFHIGADSYENTHPYRLGRIAGLFPEVPMLIVHMGGAGSPPLSRAAIETARAHPNITLIGSAIPPNAILQALESLGASRLCFGSDLPFAPMHVQLAMYQALLRDMPESDRRLVLCDNIRRVLGVAEQLPVG
jgi:predicted TIM-barrel fold metal-dependent hydrolase